MLTVCSRDPKHFGAMVQTKELALPIGDLQKNMSTTRSLYCLKKLQRQHTVAVDIWVGMYALDYQSVLRHRVGFCCSEWNTDIDKLRERNVDG